MGDLSAVRTVTICSSSRWYETARHIAEALTHAGITVHTPRFDYDEEHVTVTPEEKIWLTRDFLEKLKHADLVYVVNEQGYVGRSVCIEVGYAAALDKTIVLAEPSTEAAVTALAKGIVPADQLSTVLASQG